MAWTISFMARGRWCEQNRRSTIHSSVRAKKALPDFSELIGVSLSILAPGLGGLLDFLPVFVNAGEKKHVLAKTPTRTGNDIRDDFLVRMAEVGLAIDVINRSGYIKTLAHCGLSLSEGLAIGNSGDVRSTAVGAE